MADCVNLLIQALEFCFKLKIFFSIFRLSNKNSFNTPITILKNLFDERISEIILGNGDI